MARVTVIVEVSNNRVDWMEVKRFEADDSVIPGGPVGGDFELYLHSRTRVEAIPPSAPPAPAVESAAPSPAPWRWVDRGDGKVLVDANGTDVLGAGAEADDSGCGWVDGVCNPTLADEALIKEAPILLGIARDLAAGRAIDSQRIDSALERAMPDGQMSFKLDSYRTLHDPDLGRPK